MEIDYGPFQRQVTLAEDVDPEQATATYRARDSHDHAPDRAEAGAERKCPDPSEDVMTELLSAKSEQDELSFPATLPVLPLKETVVFPGFVTPLAIGQERSIKLVEDVVVGRPHARARHGRRTRRPSSRAGTTSTRSARPQSSTR